MDFFLAFIGVMIALVANVKTVSGYYTMDETCKQVKNGSYIGNPTNCKGYGYCKDGKSYNGTCPGDTYWDMRKGECVYTSDYKCATTVAEVCSLNPTRSYVADPLNCQRYCQCSSTSFNEATDCATCPGDYLYDAQENICNWPTAVRCSANSICRLVKDEAFAGDPNNCGQYFYCLGGESLTTTSQKCDKGTFDPLLSQCVTSYNPCASSAPSTPSSLPTNTPSKGQCLSKTSNTYVSDGETCYGFYLCDGSGSGLWGSCPYATQFDPTTELCVIPYDYNCPYDRCGNLNLTYVANAGCQTFKYCKGAGFGVLKCSSVSSSYPYFNEATGNCQATLPDYPICTLTS